MKFEYKVALCVKLFCAASYAVAYVPKIAEFSMHFTEAKLNRGISKFDPPSLTLCVAMV